MKKELANHPDQNFVNYLINGIAHGFDTGFSHLPSSPLECKNNLSARNNPSLTEELIQTELEKGFLIGPFQKVPYSIYRINPIGIAERKYSGKKRLIVDLSAPHQDSFHPSLNDLINKEDFSLQYVTIDHAIKIIQKLGKGSWLCKTDITDAFKLLPIHPSLWPYHGIKNGNNYYFFTRLVFGSRSSPKIFDTLSTAVCWIAQKNYKINNILHLLDDFLTIDYPNYNATNTMALLQHIFGSLGIPLSKSKTVGPCQELEYLGIILDTIKMEARLPDEKVVRIQEILLIFAKRRSCTKRELLSLLGHLNFACKVIPPGRSFVSYLIKLSTTVKELHHYIKLTNECRLDLNMWYKFLNGWNGKSFFLDPDFTNAADIELFTDSTMSGFGGIYKNKWFQGYFPQELLSQNEISMALLELYPIVMAVVLWGDNWTGKRILFNCDNAATVDIIKKGRSKVPLIMKFMRKLTWCSAKGNFLICASHIPGIFNAKADALSRFQMSRFRQIARHADLHPTPCLEYSDLILF